jgi:Mrp family chromosome partitioning ATPase
MGRTLETLKQGESPRTASPGSATPAEPPPHKCVLDWTLQEEVPFVEVGGPGKNIELSPSLIKHPPQPSRQPPHPAMGKAAAGVSMMPAVNLNETRPMAVTFEPWPGLAGPAAMAPEIIAFHAPEHRVSKEYTALFDKLAQGLPGPGPHVLLFYGHKPGVGTSTVLLNLAVVAARIRRRVVVVDVNLQRPALAARLGHSGAVGLCDVLGGSLALNQAVLPTAMPTLHLVPAGSLGTKSSPLTPEAIAWTVAWLRERYDLILLDGPSIEEAADLAVLAPSAAAIYLVVPQSEAINRDVALILSRMGGRLRGMIHTHFE